MKVRQRCVFAVTYKNTFLFPCATARWANLRGRRKFFCMASPQKENGYTSIANELMEAFARTPSIGSEAFQVLMLLLRRSYGFQKKDAQMSISFIAQGTGLKRRCVCRAVERLVSKRLIVRSESTIKLNKNYDEWLVSKRTPSVQTDTPPVSKRRTRVVSKRTPNKERDKETPEKETNPATTSVAEKKPNSINEILEMFQMKINPTINYGNKMQRDAVQKLLTLLGREKLIRTIEYVVAIQSEEFAPTITTPYQLKEKLAALTAYYQKKTNKPSNVVSV